MNMMVSWESKIIYFRHSGLDPESSVFLKVFMFLDAGSGPA